MPNWSATAWKSADRRSASVSSEQTNAVRRNSWPRTASSNCWCSTMSQPCSKRNELPACTMPGRSWQLSVRVSGWDTGASSALDDVERQPATGGFLVLVLHVRTGLAHGLDRLVQRDVVPAVAADGHAGRGDGLDRADGVALDAGDLHQPADRVAGEPEVVLDADLRGVLPLLGAAPDHLGEAGGGHGAGRADLALAADLRAGDGGVLLEQQPDRGGGEQESHHAVLGVGPDEVAVVVQDGRDDAGGAVGRRGDHPPAGRVLLVDGQGVERDPLHRAERVGLVRVLLELGAQRRGAPADLEPPGQDAGGPG